MNEYADQCQNQYPQENSKPANAVQPKLTPEEKEHRILHFRFFGMGSLIYALFYALCLYKNPSGITYPFFIGGTLYFFFLSLKKFGISAKKDSVFYIASLILLGISTFCTDDASIIVFNKIGIFILSFVLFLHNFYDDSRWDFTAYMKKICRLLLGTAGTIGRPFSDLHLYSQKRRLIKKENGSKGKYVFFGILISIPLLLFVILLLSSADVVFNSVMNSVFDFSYIPDNFFGICFTILAAFLISYCMVTYLEKWKPADIMPNKRTGEPVLAITVTSALSAVYLLFSGIQIVYLFFGGMELPYNYTYAEYARKGYFQLLFVCVMNLILVLICLGRFKEHKALKAILTVISLCTYIMIASSAMRMIMYIRCYALTFLRIFVLWSLAVIFLLMTGIIISIYKQHFPFFKYSMVMVTVLYLGLSFSHPDYWIAKYNLGILSGSEIYSRGTDGRYLSRLSADAAPILLDAETMKTYYKNPERDEDGRLINPQDAWLDSYIHSIQSHIKHIQSEGTKIRTFNLSRFLAEKYIESADTP